MLLEREENPGKKNLTRWSHLSGQKKRKEKKRRREGEKRGLRAEAGWAGSGSRAWPSLGWCPLLLIFFVLFLFLFSVFFISS
jgi:hypothetical protein